MHLLTTSLLHFALGRALEIAQRSSFKIFLRPLEDRFVNLTCGALRHKFQEALLIKLLHLLVRTQVRVFNIEQVNPLAP